MSVPRREYWQDRMRTELRGEGALAWASAEVLRRIGDGSVEAPIEVSAGLRTAVSRPAVWQAVPVFAVFEAAVREAWSAAFGRPTSPATFVLLESVAHRCRMPDAVRVAAHEVREARNGAVHDGVAGEFDLPAAKRALAVFVSWLPLDGGAGS